MATHGLTPDRAALDICRRAAAGLADTAPERVRSELSRLLEAERAAPALAWAARAKLLSPAFGRSVSRSAVARFAHRRVPCDAPAVRRLPPADRRGVRLAQLAAALGLAPLETARWLAARRWSRAEAGAAARLRKLDLQSRMSRTAEDDWRWIREAGALARPALALLSASEGSSRRLSARLSRRLAKSRRGPRITGADVLAWTGLAPGPEVGILLADLELAALSGRVRTRREAQKWLLARAPAIIRFP